jgi:hypothetical protein
MLTEFEPAGLIYNPGGGKNLLGVISSEPFTNFTQQLLAWLHDRVNSRRGMFLVGTTGCLVSLSPMTAKRRWS